MIKATIDNSYKTEFEHSPVFFMRVESREVQNSSDWRDTSLEYYWNSAIPHIHCVMDDKEIATDKGLKLMIADYPFISSEVKSETSDSSQTINARLSYQVHPFSRTSYYDIWFLICCMLNRKQNGKDNFYFQELLWVLDNYWLDEITLTQVLSNYNDFYLNETIAVFQDIGHCLSYEKQKKIADYLKARNIKYNIYFPEILSEALSNTDIRIQRAGANRNLFEILSLLLGYNTCGELKENEKYLRYEKNILESSSNDIIRLYRWLKDDDYNYGDLAPIIRFFSLLMPQIQLNVVKRYFHSIKQNQAIYSDEILSNFLNNRYKKFERFCNVLTTNLSPMDMTVPLLCDNIYFFIKNNGTSFQKFNGILDRTFMNANSSYNEINFNLDKILPMCDGGAVYNSNFIGFIDYRLAVELIEEKFNDEHSKEGIINLLNATGSRNFKYIYTCHADGEKEEHLMHSICTSCHNAQKRKIDLNVWRIDEKHYKEFYSYILDVQTPSDMHNPLVIELDGIDLKPLKERLTNYFNKKLLYKHKKWLVQPSFYQAYHSLFQLFFNISEVNIFNRKDVVVGCNVLKIDYVVPENIDSDQIKIERRKKEEEITKQKVKETLECITGHKMINNILELPYNPVKLDKLSKIFYYRIDKDGDKQNKLQFLTKRYIGKYPIYCSPEYEHKINDATNLPYFWCQQKECFRNVLSNQVLINTISWHDYTLFHMLEICGFPMLNESPAGFEVNPIIRNIIATVNKVRNFFDKLKCEVCGHLIWSTHSGTFNKYNHFACINNLCSEYSKDVYLSYCNKCKKGLIDSRNSAQCPNGWRICPSCYGCCNDETFEDIAQRYIASHKPVPLRIERQRGNGHNNKEIYFCPKCGGKIIDVLDKEINVIISLCENCGHQKY